MNSKNGEMPSITLAASPNIEQAELVRPNRRRLLKQMAAGAAGVGAFAFMSSAAMAETAADNAVEATAGANGYGAKLTAGLAPLMLVPGAATITGAHQAGELYVDAAGSLWYCYTSGTPGSWKQLAGVGAAPNINFLAQPLRLVTTLNPSNPIPTATSRDFTLAGLPAGVKGVAGNVTAYNATTPGGAQLLGTGSLRVFAQGGSGGNTSTLAWFNQKLPINHFQSAVSATAGITIQLVSETTGSAHVTLDIVAYFM